MANYGGPTWMCHPKLEFDKIASYQEATITTAANNALNDDCVSTYISLHDNLIPSEVQIFNNELILTITSQEKVSIKLISLNGKLVYSSKENLSAGLNRIVMDKLGIVKGMYILNITGNSGLHYRNKVALK